MLYTMYGGCGPFNFPTIYQAELRQTRNRPVPDFENCLKVFVGINKKSIKEVTLYLYVTF